MALEDLLKTINDEGERTQLQGLLEKYAPVKDAVVRGDAVAPVYARMQTMGLDFSAELNHLPEWVDYRAKHWISDANAPGGGYWDREGDAIRERDRLQARVQELETRGESDMTQEEIDARIDARLKVQSEDPKTGLVTKDVLLGSMNAQAQRFQELYRTLTPMATEHVKRYGEPIPIGEVLDYIEKHGERDPVKAYEAVCAPRNTKLEIETLKAESQKKFEEGKQAGIKEAQDRVNGQRMPVDGGGSQRSGGSHFMSKIFKRREAHASTDARLGTGAAAQAGFADYQKKQMGAGAV